MDDFENKELEGMAPDTIIFEDEDGNEFEFEVRDYFFYNGDEYALLTEVGQESDESGEECIICKVESVTGEDGEEDEEFVLVEDEELNDNETDSADPLRPAVRGDYCRYAFFPCGSDACSGSAGYLFRRRGR